MNYNWDWGIYFKSTGIGSETYLDWFITGLGWTIAIALAGWIIALALGSLLGVMRTLPNRWLSGLATAYVEIFRNVPLLVQLFLWYFLVPDLLPEPLELWFKQDLNPATSAFISVVVSLGLFTAARVCEQVRTGIQALPKGQLAAGYALGFRLPQIYANVLLPQAFRIIIPPLTSETMNIFKNSSVAFAVSVAELTMFAMQAQEETSRGIEVYLAVTALYVISAFAINRIMAFVEKRVRIPGMVVASGGGGH